MTATSWSEGILVKSKPVFQNDEILTSAAVSLVWIALVTAAAASLGSEMPRAFIADHVGGHEVGHVVLPVGERLGVDSVIEWLSSPISGVFLTRLKPIEEESK